MKKQQIEKLCKIRESRAGSHVFLLLVLGMLQMAFFSGPEKPAADVFLDNDSDMRQSEAFQKIVAAADKGKNIETYKIDYLIERVRKSPHGFIRNDVMNDGKKSSNFLRWKLFRKGKKKGVQTARDFIAEVAARSDTSGQKYWLKLLSGEKYLLQDVLINELNRLDIEIKKEQLRDG